MIKNKMSIKYILMPALLLLVFSLSLPAKEKSVDIIEKKDTKNSNELVIFDSCGKKVNDKCENKTKLPVPDYSKSLK